MISITLVIKELGLSSKEELFESLKKITGKEYSLKTTKISEKNYNLLKEYYKKESQVYKKEEIESQENELLNILGLVANTEKKEEDKTIDRNTDKKNKDFKKGINKKDNKFKYNKYKNYKKRFIYENKKVEKKEIQDKINIVKNEKTVKEVKVSDTLKKKEEVYISDEITVKEFSEKIGVPVSDVMKKLISNGLLLGINHKIDFDTAYLIAQEFGIKLIKKEKESDYFYEGNLQKILEQDKNATVERPPIVTIMGHVDHGKTSLLDYIRKTNIASKEHGGITQSIGASQIIYNGKKITFIDTPGHELFTELRARGAKITDIAIIVIAADEGIKPQTIEAINHAKDAGVPIIIAITKIDKPTANINMVKSQLSEIGLIPVDWGGDIEVVGVSAYTGEGINDLLELILLQAEIMGLKYNPNRPGVGVVLEAYKDEKKGIVANIILMTGTMKVGDSFLVYNCYGKVRKMIDWKGNEVKQIYGGDPAQILGLEDLPQPGKIIQVFSSDQEARKKLEQFKEKTIQKTNIEDILKKISEGENIKIKLIIKADSYGSLEALKNAISKIKKPDNLDFLIVHSDVGSITTSDVSLAQASGAIILGFNIPLNSSIKKLIENLKIEFKIYNIIYEVIDYLENLATGVLKPEQKEIYLGKLEILGIFYKKGNEMIVGGKVIDGKVINGCYFRIYRDNQQIGEGKVTSLKREKDNVDEVRQGYDCGLKVKINEKIELNDILEFYEIK